MSEKYFQELRDRISEFEGCTIFEGGGKVLLDGLYSTQELIEIIIYQQKVEWDELQKYKRMD